MNMLCSECHFLEGDYGEIHCCKNQGSDHYGHYLSTDHPACSAFISREQWWQDHPLKLRDGWSAGQNGA